ncbi:MAG TPA: [protein-PII] uridylyltransferase [Opitutaceae bacterium]|nr:[protein-PII] uridylyltransferase [Opitutaceae bacterium]
MSDRILKHALERLNFTPGQPVSARLQACKTFLRLESAMIRMRHDAGDSGLAVVQARAGMIDVLLIHLFDYALATWTQAKGPPPSPVCLVALGGYGRGELSPLSDIDIMFLFPSKVKLAAVKPLQEHLVNEILYMLWDCGLKVGHSTRSVDDVFAEARNDIQTKTALLESRLLAGSDVLYQGFAQAYENFYRTENPRAYLTARLEDQDARRAKFGGTVFLQEPDIKNGVGGLRDYQNAFWMARVKLGIKDMSELAGQGMRRNELRDFQRAYDFLLRVRNELHFQSKHPTDSLNLEAQPRVAFGLGYTNNDLLGRIEQFMHDYYRSAQTIFRTSKNIENRLALTLEKQTGFRQSFRDALRAYRHQRAKKLDGFVLRGQELVAETPEVFKDDPARLIRVFRHCQQLDVRPDFSLQTLIRESLPLITKRIINSRDANISFQAILSEAGSVYPTLDLMHELGVLGRFIPEFAALTCLVQHEYYHRYTADIHTLHAIRELDRIFSVAEPITLKYREALHETPDPTLLYLILLLHDLGKALGIKDHAETGVKVALPILERLQIDQRGREIVTFIIKNHLIMARFWQKHDLDDPKTAQAFGDLVDGNADNLRYLYVHTFCDARGTASGLWNGYKDTLHTSLYKATLDRLILGEAIESRNSERTQMKHQELVSQQIPGISPDEISAHFNLLPERYFIHTDTSEIALHIQMVNKLLHSISAADSVGSLKPVIDWKDDLNRSLTVVNVVTWDRAGLFYKLAGAFSVAGLNILGAKVISRTDHIAIDTFYVVEPGRGVVQNQAATETFAKTVDQALIANKDLYPDILAQAKKYSQSRYTGTPSGTETLQSSFPPTVDVYHELSLQRTIVEIQGYDQIGLLYQLAKTIYDHGFDITFARISTERGIALDTFYIESANHEPTADTSRLTALRDTLMTVIAPPEPSAPSTPLLAAK